MSVQILANSITADSTLRLRKNGAAGNLFIPIPLSTSGTFTDLVNSDVLSANDEANYQLVTGGTGTTLQLRGIQANADISQDITKTLTQTDPTISETRARQKAAWRLQP